MLNRPQNKGVVRMNHLRAIDKVWLLVHHHVSRVLTNGVDDKSIGFFSSAELAEEAKAGVAGEPGFRDVPEGFEIVEIPVDSLLPEPGVRLQY